ncbi:uncharacterized protein LOC111076329 [Drosophila obscura]|uniref:uncharacterized protein LOC111076329 n=1 Tax=Drosophila obscura TaxID=7282 RepID=UPI001BB2A900|nr:uncharacterized protein LOC111076329 [Drosophila obscura]
MSRKRNRGSPTPTQDEEQPGTSGNSGSSRQRTLTGTGLGQERSVDQNGERADVPDEGESSHRVPDPPPATVDFVIPTDPPPTKKRNRSLSPTKARASMDLTHHQHPVVAETDRPHMLDFQLESDPRPKRRDTDAKSKTPKRRIRVPHILVQADAPEAPRLMDTGVSTDSQRVRKAPSAIEPISELPYVEPVYILVQAERPQPPRLVDTAVGTDPGRAHSNPSARRHPTKPSAHVKDRAQPVDESDIDEGSSNYSSSHESALYDIEDHEILITKTEKVYKKRPDKVLPLDDSDESFDAFSSRSPQQQQQQRISKDSRAYEEHMDSDAPPSIDNMMMAQYTDLSDTSTSSSSKRKGTPGLGLGLAGNNLASGYVFIYMVIPPDGGYGWIVLVLSFLAQLIVDGIVFSIGILLPFMAKDFEANDSRIVFVASIQIGCYFMGGAFSSALINSYGFRPVAMTGVIISALSILAASFSPNLAMMIVFYSIIGGPALSMIWVSSQLIIGYYFERYRALASGFSCSGAGAGIVVFSFLNSWLVPLIGWRNVLRVHVCLLLCILMIACAYVEVAPTQVGVLNRPAGLMESSSEEYYGNFYVHNFLRDSHSRLGSQTILETYEPHPKRAAFFRRISPCCTRKEQDDEERPLDEDRNLVIRTDPILREDLFYTGPVEYDKPHSTEQVEGKEMQLLGSAQHTQKATYGIAHIQGYTSDDKKKLTGPGQDSPGSPMSYDERPGKSASRIRMARRRPLKKRHWLHNKIVKALNRLFDYHLLESFEFRVLVASAFFYPMGFNIPFVYSKARTDIPSEYANLIGPAIGFMNFAMRISCGFAAYKLRGCTTYICGGGMFFGGFFVFISAFFGSDIVWFQLLYGLCYGVAPAVYATLRALIYVRYLGLSKLTNAFGITALAMGMGVFIGTTMGGILVEATQGYSAAFAMAGFCIMLSGSLKLLLPTMVRLHKRKQTPRHSYQSQRTQ